MLDVDDDGHHDDDDDDNCCVFFFRVDRSMGRIYLRGSCGHELRLVDDLYRRKGFELGGRNFHLIYEYRD